MYSATHFVVTSQSHSSRKVNISPKVSSFWRSSINLMSLPIVLPTCYHCGEHRHLRPSYEKLTFHPHTRVNVSTSSSSTHLHVNPWSLRLRFHFFSSSPYATPWSQRPRFLIFFSFACYSFELETQIPSLLYTLLPSMWYFIEFSTLLSPIYFIKM